MQSDCYLDLEAFEASVTLPQANDPLTLEADQVASLEQGIGLCRGEILEGFYSDWALRERERIRDMRVVALHKLMEHYGQGNCYHDAIRCARLILESDPLREDVHRRLILLCNAAGDRAGAVRQYRFCRELLRRELGVYPMPETEACFQMVLGDQAAPDKGGPRLASQDRDHLQKAVAALHESVHSMFTFARELEQLLSRLQTHDR